MLSDEIALVKVYKNKSTEKAVSWAKRNPERVRAAKKRYAERHPRDYNGYRTQKPLKQLIIGARCSAKRRGLEFTITEHDLSLIATCPVLGIKINWIYGTKGAASPNCPSIDRIDSTKGYIPGNVQVISYRANVLKGNATLPELEAITKYMRDALAAVEVKP